MASLSICGNDQTDLSVVQKLSNSKLCVVIKYIQSNVCISVLCYLFLHFYSFSFRDHTNTFLFAYSTSSVTTLQ